MPTVLPARPASPLAASHQAALPLAASDLAVAVQVRFACDASLLQTVPVRARITGGRICDVDVHIFALGRTAKSHTAYAWRHDDRIFTALDIGPIRSPTDAVCAALADEARRRNLALCGLAAA